MNEAIAGTNSVSLLCCFIEHSCREGGGLGGGGGLATLPTTSSPLGSLVIEVSDLAVSWNVVG